MKMKLFVIFFCLFLTFIPAALADNEDGLFLHKIQLIQDNKVQFVLVDPMNGNVLAISGDYELHDQ